MSVSVSEFFACAVTIGGDVYCWGDNSMGQLGNGGMTVSPGAAIAVPAASKVVGLPGPAKAVVTNESTACAIVANGDVYCWGDNSVGELGIGFDGTVYELSPTAVKVPGLTGITTMAGAEDGGYFTEVIGGIQLRNANFFCATDGSSVWCWGAGQAGETQTFKLQNGITIAQDSSVPAKIAGLPSPITALAAENNAVCVVVANAQVWCWGYGGDAQGEQPGTLIDGPAYLLPGSTGCGTTCVNAPTLISGLPTTSAVVEFQLWDDNSSSYDLPLGRVSYDDGSVWAWGSGFEAPTVQPSLMGTSLASLAYNRAITGILGISGFGSCAKDAAGRTICSTNTPLLQEITACSGRVTDSLAASPSASVGCYLNAGLAHCLGSSNARGELGTGSFKGSKLLDVGNDPSAGSYVGIREFDDIPVVVSPLLSTVSYDAGVFVGDAAVTSTDAADAGSPD